MISGTGILFIEPQREPSDYPLIDALTIKMAHALRRSSAGTFRNGILDVHSGYRGVHNCSCGARGTNRDHILRNGALTHSLATHYLAYHRNEVPDEQLDRVRQLPEPDLTPTIDELVPPPSR